MIVGAGVHVRQLYRWRRYGVTWAQADELAVRVGYRPGDVWGAYWWALNGEDVAIGPPP